MLGLFYFFVTGIELFVRIKIISKTRSLTVFETHVIPTEAPLLSCESKKRGEMEESALSLGLLTEKTDLSTRPVGLGRGDEK